MAVMESTINKLDILSCVPETQRSELAADLKMSQRDRLQHLWLSESAASKPQNLRVMMRQLVASVQRDSQMQDLLETKCKKQSAILSLRETLKKLKDIARRKLTQTVEDAQHKKTFINMVRARLEKSLEDRKNLADRLDTIRNARAESTTALDNERKALKGELSFLKQNASNNASDLSKKAQALSSSAEQAHVVCMKDLETQKAKLEEQLAEIRSNNKSEEQAMRKKKKMQQISLQTWVDKYDKEVTAKHKEVEELKSSLKSEKQELEVLRDHFRKIDDEYARINEEERLIELEKKKEEMKEKVRHDAALKIQVCARNYLCKINFKKKGKKGGKKKGGKKKKGKKKKKKK